MIDSSTGKGPDPSGAARPETARAAGGGWPSTPPALLGRRYLAALLLGACLLTVIMHRPLLSQFSSAIPFELRDPALQAWQVAWGGHALLNEPLDFFDSNAFFPLDNSLAFSDALIGYAPFGIFGSGPDAALIRYNLLFLFCYALAFLGAALLARELGVSHWASAVAGSAYAYAPWRLSQDNHMHVIASGGIPLALFLLVRGHRKGSPGMIVAGWVTAAWQVSIGFTLGILLVYLLAVLAAVAAIDWWRSGRPRLPRPVVVATAMGTAFFLSWCALQAMPLLDTYERFPESRRSPFEAAVFSPKPRSLLVAPEASVVWGEVTKPMRDTLNWWPEQSLFPGLAIAELALVGIFTPVLTRRLRLGLLAGGVFTLLMSFGYGLWEGRWTYRFLFDFVPGFSGSRTPGRIYTLTSLALALLAAGAVHWLATKADRAGPLEGFARQALPLVAMLVILVEGLGRLNLAPVPDPPTGQLGITAPALHLPTDEFNDTTYMYWSTHGFPPISNGQSGFVPGYLDQLRREMPNFPTPETVALVRSLGIEVVILHPELTVNSAYFGMEERSVTGLGVRKEVRPGVVLFWIGEPP